MLPCPIEVKVELDIAASGKGSYLSARNETIRIAEQEIINNYEDKGISLKNEVAAATPEKKSIWKVCHSVEFNADSSKVALKGGTRVNSVMGISRWFG